MAVAETATRYGDRGPMATSAELNQFLSRVEKRAYGMAVMAVKNPDDALDIVQDVMLTLARKYAGKPSEELAPLFYRMLRNRIVDFQRSQNVRRRVFGWFSRGDDDNGAGTDPVDTAPARATDEPDAQRNLGQSVSALDTALAELPARQREAFLLRAWEGLDVAATARAMGVSTGSVKTHYARAVQALRDKVEDPFDD